MVAIRAAPVILTGDSPMYASLQLSQGGGVESAGLHTNRAEVAEPAAHLAGAALPAQAPSAAPVRAAGGVC